MEAFYEKRRYDTNLRVWTCCYNGLTSLPHYHREIELLYIRQGCAHVGINSQSYTCYGGDLVISQTGDMHYSNSENEDNILDFIVFEPSVLETVYSNDRSLQSVLTAKELKKTGMDEIVQRMYSTVHSELKNQEMDFDTIIKLTLSEFWVKYIRYFGQTRTEEDRQPMVTALAKLQKLLDYIEDNFAADISLSDAAEIMGYEVCHCSKVFKKLTGVNFTEYLNNVKIGKAIEMIRKSKYSITDIAMRCGFNNIRTFNRVFKSITKMTPTHFMNTNRIVPEFHSQAKPISHMTSTVISCKDSWV